MIGVTTQRDLKVGEPYQEIHDIMDMSKEEVNANVGKVYIRQHMLSHKKTLSNFYPLPSEDDRQIYSSGL